MRSATVVILLAAFVQAQSQWQALQSKVGISPVPLASRVAQTRWNQAQAFQSVPTIRFPTLAERSVTAAAQAEAAGDESSAVAEVPTSSVAEEEQEDKVEYRGRVRMTAPRSTSGPQSALNIFDESTEACTAGQSEHCFFESASPRMCVDILKFDYKIAGAERFGKAGARCVSIWDLPTKEYEEYKGQYKIVSDDAFRFGVQRFALQCSSLPIDVFNSEYTKDEWSTCQVYTKDYLLAEKGFENWEKVSVEDTVKGRCFRFRRAMNAICNTCVGQASSDSAKAALRQKCAALGEGEALVEMNWLFGRWGKREDAACSAVVAALVIALALLGRVVFRFSRHIDHAGQEPLLRAA